MVIQSSMCYVPVKNIQRTSTPTTSAGRTYKINNEDYKKLFLHLQNFSNNKLLYIAILLFPFAKCFTSVNKCLIRNLKYGNTHICDFQTFITSLNLNKKPSSLQETLPKNCLLYLKIVSEQRKNKLQGCLSPL